MKWFIEVCEYLGGERDQPPSGFRADLGSLWWGLWWGWLGTLIAVFSGQSSKFIYIDF